MTPVCPNLVWLAKKARVQDACSRSRSSVKARRMWRALPVCAILSRIGSRSLHCRDPSTTSSDVSMDSMFNRVFGGSPSHRTAPGGLVGELEIPRLHLSTVVIEGDDEAALRVTVGHLADTPLPWEEGNSAFAARRDFYFHPLKDVRIGDLVRVTPRGVLEYHVRETLITNPADVWSWIRRCGQRSRSSRAIRSRTSAMRRSDSSSEPSRCAGFRPRPAPQRGVTQHFFRRWQRCCSTSVRPWRFRNAGTA